MHYFNDERSGVSGFHKMSSGWKEVAEKVKAQQSINDEKVLVDAITSWYQEEKDMTLMLSRKLGVLVKTIFENPKNKLNRDIKKLKKEHCLSTKLRVRGAVSDIKVKADFDRRTISMSVDVTPPLNKGVIARITWIKNQLDKIDNKSSVFGNLENKVSIISNDKTVHWPKMSKAEIGEKLSDLIENH